VSTQSCGVPAPPNPTGVKETRIMSTRPSGSVDMTRVTSRTSSVRGRSLLPNLILHSSWTQLLCGTGGGDENGEELVVGGRRFPFLIPLLKHVHTYVHRRLGEENARTLSHTYTHTYVCTWGQENCICIHG
jgi:hypothetical protein